MGTVSRGAGATVERGPLVSFLAEASEHVGGESEFFLASGPFSVGAVRTGALTAPEAVSISLRAAGSFFARSPSDV
jgi:hypothetical protein